MKMIPLISKFKSRKEWEEYIWSQLAMGLANANSMRQIKEFLDMLLTAHEKKQMIKRASAISLLKQGKSYSEIGEILWLSPTTISAIRKGIRTQKGYISRYTLNKKPEKKQKPLTKQELEQLQFSLWLGALLTLPPPPIPHPRLVGYRYFKKRR